jgi:hypothetical protein
MRQKMFGFAVAMVAAVAAAPAMACGSSPCGTSSYGYSSYSYAAPVQWQYARVAIPQVQYYTVAVPQYYYVNQGPTYTGPGMFAPAPYYQERTTTSAWRPYSAGVSYAPRPVAYGYSWPRRHYHAPRYGYRYGYAPRYRHAVRYGYAPRVRAHRSHINYGYAPRYRIAPHQYGGHRVLRRYY